jgi:hypothetical protein
MDALTKRVDALDALAKLLPWLKGLVVGAFALGIWVATIELRVESLTRERSEMKAFERELIELKTDVRWIRENLK